MLSLHNTLLGLWPYDVHERPVGQRKFLESIKVHSWNLVSSLVSTLGSIVYQKFTDIRNDSNTSITPIYNTWIIDKVTTFNTKIQGGMNNMLEWWNEKNGIAEVAVCEILGNHRYVR